MPARKKGPSMPAGPMYGPGRAEYIKANIQASRAGNAASGFRNAQGFVGEYGPTRADYVKANISASKKGRTGGYKASGIGLDRPYGPPKPKPITTPPPRTTPRPPAGGASDAVGTAVKKAKGDGLRGLMKGRGKGIAIGMGAAVIGGLAYSGRRGEGSSGGRAGMSRY